eukprot:TRINITY_DN31024_c0_g1_i1.p1 TRINITY_DN31024_c0_g1~~TRINITY_DN31024_c0_g1_i1.p1  ORF type:complete len:866 (+),score=141.67 TRINITY_DN31024_c0_g1_i1:157-2754(+)
MRSAGPSATSVPSPALQGAALSPSNSLVLERREGRHGRPLDGRSSDFGSAVRSVDAASPTRNVVTPDPADLPTWRPSFGKPSGEHELGRTPSFDTLIVDGVAVTSPRGRSSQFHTGRDVGCSHVCSAADEAPGGATSAVAKNSPTEEHGAHLSRDEGAAASSNSLGRNRTRRSADVVVVTVGELAAAEDETPRVRGNAAARPPSTSQAASSSSASPCLVDSDRKFVTAGSSRAGWGGHCAAGANGGVPPERMRSQPSPATPLGDGSALVRPCLTPSTPSLPLFDSSDVVVEVAPEQLRRRVPGSCVSPHRSSLGSPTSLITSPRGRNSCDRDSCGDTRKNRSRERSESVEAIRDNRDRGARPRGDRKSQGGAGDQATRSPRHSFGGERTPPRSGERMKPLSPRRTSLGGPGRGSPNGDVDLCHNAQDPSVRVQELRVALDRELTEKKRLEARNEALIARISESEALAGKLNADFQEVRNQRDALRRQVKLQGEKHVEVSRKIRCEQETKRQLEIEISKVNSARQDLAAKMQSDQLEKTAADLVSAFPRQRKELSCEESASIAIPGLPCASGSSLESQLEQIRRQLEETLREVQNRRGPTSMNASAEKVRGASGRHGSSKRASSPANLSLMETTSPCSSIDVVGIAAVSSDPEDGSPFQESELPAEGRLIGEWSAQQVGCISVESSLGGNGSDSLGAPAEPSPSAAPEVADEPKKDRRKSTLGAMSLRDLSEIKALKRPPTPVRVLMEVCCLLFSIQPERKQDEKNCKKWSLDYWETARRSLLSDPFFPSKLRLYDPSQLSPALQAKIKRYFLDPEFTGERVRACSKAAFELYNWVRILIEQDPARKQSSVDQPRSPCDAGEEDED